MDNNPVDLLAENIPGPFSNYYIETTDDVKRMMLIWNNCHWDERCNRWNGYLRPKSGKEIGCGINSLRFLSAINANNIDLLFKKVDEPGVWNDGMPFDYIVEIFNIMLQNTPNFTQFENHTSFIEEYKLPIDNADNIEDFFEILDLYMPENSCILVRLNRDGQQIGLSSGHYVVITKSEGNLITIEPHLSTEGSCISRTYVPPPSANFVRAWNYQYYNSASILLVTYSPIVPAVVAKKGGGKMFGGGKGYINGAVEIPVNMTQKFEDSLEQSIECNEPRVGGKKTRRRKTRRKKTNKKRAMSKYRQKYKYSK